MPAFPDLAPLTHRWPPPAAQPQPGLPNLEQLHPALWRAHQTGRQRDAVVASGYAELDAVLPGGGWPQRALTELLLPHPGIGEIRLLAPALAAVQQGGRGAMLFGPPAALCGWTLAALGLDLRQLVLVQPRRPAGGGPPPAAELLWALEQALKCGHVGVVLAWFPAPVRPDAVRRLQLAAQAHDGPAFLLRDLHEQSRPSAAPLRLALGPAGPDELALHVVKRRGPPLAQPLLLPLAPVLSAPARARALQTVALPAAAPPAPAPEPVPAGPARSAGHP